MSSSLATKLAHYGIQGDRQTYRWNRSWLTLQMQCVVVDGAPERSGQKL